MAKKILVLQIVQFYIENVINFLSKKVATLLPNGLLSWNYSIV